MDARTWIETNLDTQQGKHDDTLSVNCPFCTDAGKSPDWKHHLQINLEKSVCHCFRCDYGGTLIRLVRDVSGVSYAEATQILDAQPRTGKRLRLRPPPAAPDPTTCELPKEYRPLNPKNFLHRAALAYLYGRGLLPNNIRDFELGFCVTGDYSQRVIIPVKRGDKVVGFTARAIHPNVPRKYMTPPGFRATQYLYNFERARGSDLVVVMEGPADVWNLPDKAMGLFTNKMSDAQAALVIQHWKRAIVMLDQDAKMAAYEIYKKLAVFLPCGVAVLPYSKDPGEADKMEIVNALVSARTGLEALL